MQNKKSENKSSAVQELLQKVKNGSITDFSSFHKAKLSSAKKFHLSRMPSNSDIAAIASVDERKAFKNILSIKPVRSLSGVSVVAVMTPPAGCVGTCIYCPVSLVEGMTPKSYTGKEPSTMRSLMFNYNPYKIVENRLHQYDEINKPASKIEIIFQGGTFPAESFVHQKYFVKRCIDAVNEKTSKNLSQAKLLAESSEKRIVGITFETRPDQCSKLQINRMLNLGGTRVEMGVQIPSDEVYKKIARGHLVKDVVQATQRLKDSAFKVCYHLMPGLYGSSPKHDIEKLQEVFSNKDFMPDMVKIYPCLVIEKTPLYELWKKGKFFPYDTEQASEVISEIKRVIPKWVRVMRIQRDIPADVIAAGVKNSNLREFVEKKMHEKGIECNCIRCREAGLKSHKLKKQIDFSKVKLLREDYDASNGKEIFLSFEEPEFNALIGFARLRIPFNPFRKEIDSKTALIRELHVFGEALRIGDNALQKDTQHKGFGKKLMQEAERIALEEFDIKKLTVIAGLGVRDYYRSKLGYFNDGVFVSKFLSK